MVWLYLLFFNLHYAYRYIFKYNAETTSPTYSDTPLAFQLPKYLVFAGAFYFITLCFLSRPELRPGRGAFWALFLGFYFTAGALVGGVFDSPEFVKAHVLPVYPFLMLFAIRLAPGDFRGLHRLAYYVFWFHVAFSAIQVALFFLFDRLPALAYPDSLMVRFGGGLDDPNSFAPLAFAFCVYLFDSLVWSGFSWRRLWLLVGCSVLFLWTMSFTAYLTAVPCGLFYLALRRSYRLATSLCLGVAVVAAAVVLSPVLDLLIALQKMKLESASAHFDWSWQDFLDLSIVNQIFGALGSWDVKHIESDFVFQIFNYGWAGMALLTGFWIAAMIRLNDYFRLARSQSLKTMILCIMVYLFMFFVGNWNLPYFRLVPININYWFIVFAVLSQDGVIRRLLSSGGLAPAGARQDPEKESQP